ncbi:MAG: helix-turn-helix domain-containing protein [Oscillospiraceae bacterium]
MKETILTREEVMEVLKIGKSTFYKLVHDGTLKAFKEGNRYKVPSSSVDEYIINRMNQTEGR